MIAERLPATLELSIVSAVIAIVLGLIMGVYTALNRDGAGSRLVMFLSLVGVSLPTFLIGILMIYLFAVTLPWLPSFGRGQVVDLGWWTTGLLTFSGLKAIIIRP